MTFRHATGQARASMQVEHLEELIRAIRGANPTSELQGRWGR